jgi:hypothetical protein
MRFVASEWSMLTSYYVTCRGKFRRHDFGPAEDGARLGCHRRGRGQLANGISQVDYDKRNIQRAYWAIDADCAEYFIRNR